jgi:ATPase family associated with various cellular activities (AAA)
MPQRTTRNAVKPSRATQCLTARRGLYSSVNHSSLWNDVKTQIEHLTQQIAERDATANATNRPAKSKGLESWQKALNLSDFQLDALLLLIHHSTRITAGGISSLVSLNLLASLNADDSVSDDDFFALMDEESPFRQWELVQFHTRDEQVQFYQRELVVTDWTLAALHGKPEADKLFKRAFTRDDAEPMRFVDQRETTARVKQAMSEESVLVQFIGDEEALQKDAARGVAKSAARDLYTLKLNALPTANEDLQALALVWNRFARVTNAILTINAKVDDAERIKNAVGWLEGNVIITTRDAFVLPREALTLEIYPLSKPEQQVVWRNLMQPFLEPLGVSENLERAAFALASKFDFTADLIELAVSRGHSAFNPDSSHDEHSDVVVENLEVDDDELELTPNAGQNLSAEDALNELFHCINEAALKLVRPRFKGLAKRINIAQDVDISRLVLPPNSIAQIQKLIQHAQQRRHVFEGMGWTNDSHKGFGLTALFSGSSGTGKTFAAEIIAKALGLDLYIVDLSQLVSKYIGDTEKGLAEIFEAATLGGCILLFDEGDTIFGKRNEASSGHDRYANNEVSFLLQAIERYKGLAIITTNLEANIDEAFMRRIWVVIRFPKANQIEPETRAIMWQAVFPKGTRLENVDFAALGKVEYTGGQIRNVALAACFEATAEGVGVRMRHIKTAISAEQVKNKSGERLRSEWGAEAWSED